MAGFPATMWLHNGQDASVRAVVGTVATPLIEQDKPFVLEQRFHLAEANVARTVPQLVKQFMSSRHFRSAFRCYYGAFTSTIAIVSFPKISTTFKPPFSVVG